MKDGVTKACKDPRIIKHEVIKGLPKRCIGDLKRMARARDVKLHRSEADTIRMEGLPKDLMSDAIQERREREHREERAEQTSKTEKKNCSMVHGRRRRKTGAFRPTMK